MTRKSAIIAATVASFFVAAGAFAGDVPTGKAAAKSVQCAGINSCKGQGSCASASNSCAGQNACSGKGVVTTSAKECSAKHGTVVADGMKKGSDKKD